MYLAGVTRCQTPGCQKIAYPSWYAARLETLRAATDANAYLEEYQCKETPGVWHVTSMDKKLANIKIQIVRRDSLLRQRQHLQKITTKPDNNHQPFDKKQLKTIASLLTPTTKQKKPWLYHQRHRKRGPNRFWRFNGRARIPRTDRPALKGASMAQMLAWANGGTYCAADFNSRWGHSDLIRRRNRARERVKVRRDIFDDLSYGYVVAMATPYWAGYSDNDSPGLTGAQWRAAAENEDNIVTVQFSGYYTTESKWE